MPKPFPSRPSPSCWEVAQRRATLTRERRRKRRGRNGTPMASAVVRDLVASLEGTFMVALALTVATAVVEMAAGLLRRPVPRPAVPSASRRPAAAGRPPEVVHGLAGFGDASPGETLTEYRERHRQAAEARYRVTPRTQARWMRRALLGDEGAVARLMPELRAALVDLDPTAAADLAMMSRERLAREIPAILVGAYAPPPGGPPDAAPDAAPMDDGQEGGPPPGPRPPHPPEV